MNPVFLFFCKIATFFTVLSNVLEASYYIFKIIWQYQTKKAVAAEVKAAVKEVAEDPNSKRAAKVFDPKAEPFPRINENP